jgi:hypothetical protein
LELVPERGAWSWCLENVSNVVRPWGSSSARESANRSRCSAIRSRGEATGKRWGTQSNFPALPRQTGRFATILRAQVLLRSRLARSASATSSRTVPETVYQRGSWRIPGRKESVAIQLVNADGLPRLQPRSVNSRDEKPYLGFLEAPPADVFTCDKPLTD